VVWGGGGGGGEGKREWHVPPQNRSPRKRSTLRSIICRSREGENTPELLLLEIIVVAREGKGRMSYFLRKKKRKGRALVEAKAIWPSDSPKSISVEKEKQSRPDDRGGDKKANHSFFQDKRSFSSRVLTHRRGRKESPPRPPASP